MSAHNDTAFLRMFLMILGALVAFTVIIMIAANMIGGELSELQANDPQRLEAVAKRIKPLGQVNVAGETKVAPAAVGQATSTDGGMASTVTGTAAGAAAAASQATSAGSDAGAAVDKGQQIYQSACFACHGTGVLGAPKLGDIDDWGPRISQGAETLLQHVVDGFQGKVGYMPPKGGRADLSDGDVTAAIAYMVSQSQ